MNHEGPEFTAPDDQRCEALLRASKDHSAAQRLDAPRRRLGAQQHRYTGVVR